MNLVLIKNLHF